MKLIILHLALKVLFCNDDLHQIKNKTTCKEWFFITNQLSHKTYLDYDRYT